MTILDLSGMFLSGSQGAPAQVLGVHVTGQSLGVGGGTGGPVLTTPDATGNVMLASSAGFPLGTPTAPSFSFTPLVSPLRPIPGTASAYPTNIAGEQAGNAFARQLTALARTRSIASWRQAVSNVGEVGAAMSVIQRGGSGNAFAAMLDNSQSFKFLANSLGLTYESLVQYLVHGETDATIGNTNYFPECVQLQADGDTFLRAITGQANPVPMVVTQQNSSPTTSGLGANITAVDQWQLQVQHPDKFVLACAKYPYNYIADHVHMVEDQYPLVDEIAAWAYWQFRTTGSWKPLMPIAFNRVGLTVNVNFHVPDGGFLVTDLTVVGPHQTGSTYASVWGGAFGFEAYDDSGTIAITAAPGVGNSYNVTLGRTPTTNLKVGLAQTADTGGAGFGGPFRCSQLRGSTTFTGAVTGTPQHHWAVAFTQAVA